MKRYVLLLSLSLSAGLLILLLSILGLLEPIELRTLDWRFGLRGSRDPSSDISIVLVERRYVKSLARSSYAKFLTLYREASSIGFDLIFDQPNDEAYRDEDLVFAAACSIANVYCSFGKRKEAIAEQDDEWDDLAERTKALRRFGWEIGEDCRGKLERLDRTCISAPLHEFSQAAKGIGHVYAAKEPGKVLRKIPLLVEYEGKSYPLLSLQMACDFLKVKEKEIHPGKHIRLVTEEGRIIRIPIDKKGYMFINYVGPFERYSKQQYTLGRIMEDYESQPDRVPTLSGVILVGAVMEEGNANKGTLEKVDHCLTPLGDYPGVGIHANILDNILRGNFLHRTGLPGNVVISHLLGLGVSGIALKSLRPIHAEKSQAREYPPFASIRSIMGLLMTLALIGVYLGIAILLFGIFDIWMEMVAPVLVLMSVALVYFVISVWQIDKKLSLLFRPPMGKWKVLRYFLAGAFATVSIVLGFYRGEKIAVAVLAIAFFITALRIAGLISAGVFEEQISKISDKLIPGSKDKKGSKKGDNEL